MHRAILFDRYRLFVDALGAVLRAAGVEIAGKATSNRRALDLVEAHAPDLVVVGLGGPDADDALAVVSSATSASPVVKAIVIARDAEPHRIDEAFAAGATAFVANGATLDDIAFAIKHSFDHSIHFAPDPRVRAESASRGASPPGMSERETQILRLVADGKSNGDVARELRITEQTVKFHLSNIYRKLNVTNRTQASRRAQELGLVSRVRA